MSFTSDFYLTPINIKAKEGFATWHKDTDPSVHDLMDGHRVEPVLYTRKRIVNNQYQDCQDCQVFREDENKDGTYNIILLPGDGSKYSVIRKSTINKIKDETTEDETIVCIICLVFKKNHAMIPCGHIVSCTRCVRDLLDNDNRCPICRVVTTQVLRVFM
jgi:hypothetical protein